MTALATAPAQPDQATFTHVVLQTEDNFMRAVRKRDPQALERVVREHGPRMYSVARRMLGCEHDAVDALQDAFVSAMRSIDMFREEARLSTWLHRVIVNVCLMKLRSRMRERSAYERMRANQDAGGTLAGREPSTDPCNSLDRKETLRWVRDCIDRLPERHRQVIILRDIEQLSTQATASLLDCSTENVKTRLHRARLALRNLLAHATPNDPQAS